MLPKSTTGGVARSKDDDVPLLTGSERFFSRSVTLDCYAPPALEVAPEI